ncbi:hypothetical protein H3146_24085, partial [Streptomyces sp. OF3]|nr:hypothetical protein [Streptomyces alkaliterrae]
MTTATTTAPVALLHQVGARAVDWLHRHRDGFRPRRDPGPPAGERRPSDPSDEWQAPGPAAEWEVKDRLKPIGELAIIGKVLFREGVAGSRQAALARQLLDAAWRDHLEGGRLLRWMQDREPLSPIPFEIYVPFRELGYHDPEFEEHLRH